MSDAGTLHVGTVNVWGRWADWPARLETMRQTWPQPGPDVVLLQEVRVDDGGRQADEIAEALGYPHRAWAEGHQADDGSEGLAILSRLPLQGCHEDLLPESDPPRRVLVADVAWDGGRAAVACGHTVATPDDARRAQVDALLARPGSPLVLGADLNEPPALVAPLIREAGLLDCLDGRDAPTWPTCRVTFGEAWLSQLGRAPHFSLEPRRLDYLLARGLEVVASGVDELRGDDGRYASDHAMVWARLRIAPVS